MQILLYVVRHGATKFNGDSAKIRGHLAIPLAPEGEQEAECAAEALAGKPIGAIWASSLHRTVQTAAIISKALDTKVKLDSGLTTWDTGDWSGQPAKIVRKEMQEAILHPEMPVPGGETYGNFYGRWKTAFLKALATAKKDNAPIVLITHEANILAMLHLINAKTPLLATSTKAPGPGSVIAVGEDKGKLQLEILHKGSDTICDEDASGTEDVKYSPAKDGPFRCDRCVHYQGTGQTAVCGHPKVEADPEVPKTPAGKALVEGGGCCEYYRVRNV